MTNIIAPDDPALEALQEAIKYNNSLHVNLEIVPWKDYQNTLMSALESEISSKQAVFIPGHIWLPSLANKGYISDLNLLFNLADESLKDNYKIEDLIPIIKSESTFKGSLYQLPFFSDGHIIYYKDEIFDSKESVPEFSVKQIYQIAKDNNNPPKSFGISLKADKSEIFTDFLPYLWEFDGVIFDKNLNPLLNHPNNIEALEFYCSLREFAPLKTENYGNEEIANSLIKSESAVITTWGGQSAPLFLRHNIKYKAATFKKPWNATWGAAIPQNQPEQTKIETLNTLLELFSKNTDRLVTKIAGSPVRQSSYTKEEFEKYPWLQAQYEMLKRAKPLPGEPKLGEFLGLLYEYVHKAFIKELSPKEALDEVQRLSQDLVE